MAVAFAEEQLREGVSNNLTTTTTTTTSSNRIKITCSVSASEDDDMAESRNNHPHTPTTTIDDADPHRIRYSYSNVVVKRSSTAQPHYLQQVNDYCKNNCHKSSSSVRGECGNHNNNNYNETFVEETLRVFNSSTTGGVGSPSNSSAIASQSVSKQQSAGDSSSAAAVAVAAGSQEKTKGNNHKKKPKSSTASPSQSGVLNRSEPSSKLVTRRDPSETDRHVERVSSQRSSSRGKQIIEHLPRAAVTVELAQQDGENYEELSSPPPPTGNIALSRPSPTIRNNHSSLFADHVYENLTYIENCYRLLPPVRNTPQQQQEEDNIYENICDKCDQIFSGELCKNCVKHKTNSASGGGNGGGERKKRSFSDFFNSLKRRQKADKKPVAGVAAAAKRIEIVHNVDGFVVTPFKANQTFDLQEICALKLIHQQQQLKQKQLLNETVTTATIPQQPQVEITETEEEVVWRRKRRRSGEPEIPSKDEIKRELPNNNDSNAEEDDGEEEDAFIAPNLNLNSLRSAYESLVESLGTQKVSPPDGSEANIDNFEGESATRIETDQLVEVAPLNRFCPRPGNESNDSPELNEPATVAIPAVVIPINNDETIRPSTSVIIESQQNRLEQSQNHEEEKEEELHTEPELISAEWSSPLENNTLGLSVRQWMTSLLHETNDDEDLLVLGQRDVNYSAGQSDWFFVKHIPSRSFEEHFYYSPSSAVWPSSHHHHHRSKSGSPDRSSCESDLNVRINCFKSEVNKNLEQQRKVTEDELRQREKGSHSIVITVKDEIRYQEEEEDQRNEKWPNNCIPNSSDFNSVDLDKRVTQVNENETQIGTAVEVVEKSSVEKVPKNCINFGGVILTTNSDNISCSSDSLDNNRSAKVDVLLSPCPQFTGRRSCVGGGGGSSSGCLPSDRRRCRRNAITEQRRNSLKFQLITLQLVSRGIRRTVFCVAARVQDQLAVLKGVLRANKRILRSQRAELVAVTVSRVTLVELIMGVLSLVDSVKEEAGVVALRGATVDRPTNGQNDLDGPAIVPRKKLAKNLDKFNIESKMVPSANSNDKEAIYQPIWKFHTVGIGRESTSSDTFDGSYNTSDFAEVGDTVEWEIAEEFQFGNSRETLLDSSAGSGRGHSTSLDKKSSSSSGRSMSSVASSSGETQSTVTLGESQLSINKAEENIYEDVVPKWRYSYQPVCILYDLGNATNNAIIYNYDGNRSSAQTRRQIHGAGGETIGNSSQQRRSASASGDNVAPLFVSGGKWVRESEKLLAAERNERPLPTIRLEQKKQQQQSKQQSRVVVGYECEDGDGDTPTQCCSNNNSNNSGSNCYGSTTTTTTKSYEGANEKVMPPKVYLIPDSVAAWKFMLLDTNYAEDEEDVIMSVPNLLDINYDTPVMLETKKLPPLQVPSKESKLQKTNLLNPRKYVMSGRLNIEDQKTNYLHKSIVGSYKQIEFGSVDNLNFLSKSKSTSSILSSSPTKKSPRFLRFRPNSPRDEASKQDKQRTVVFGSDLNTMKLDPDTGAPKFVVECIRLIEEPENIQTNGVYRASGNKNSIEMVKKRMNDRLNLRKDTIWQFLEKQDVHTLTGSLKLFFRGLSAQLIPDFLFDQLPDHLGDETSLESIRIIMDELEEVPRATIKFLIKHLTVVTENKAENLMNSSNLSICWGACLFASSATAFDSFESGNIIRKNHFVKVLIDHYHQIFEK